MDSLRLFSERSVWYNPIVPRSGTRLVMDFSLDCIELFALGFHLRYVLWTVISLLGVPFAWTSPQLNKWRPRRLGSQTFSVIGFSMLAISCGPLVFSSLGYVFHSGVSRLSLAKQHLDPQSSKKHGAWRTASYYPLWFSLFMSVLQLSHQGSRLLSREMLMIYKVLRPRWYSG